MIRAILFDADGVLVHHTDITFSNRLAAELQIDPREVEAFFTESFENALLGKADMVESITPYAKRWGWPGTIQELLDFWFVYEHNANKELVAYIAGLKEQGIRCYIATNNEKYRAEAMFKALGFADIIDKMYVASYLGALKPNPIYFQKVLDDIGDIDKSEILLWDDTPGNVASAKAFGMQGEVFTNFENFVPVMESYLV